MSIAVSCGVLLTVPVKKVYTINVGQKQVQRRRTSRHRTEGKSHRPWANRPHAIDRSTPIVEICTNTVFQSTPIENAWKNNNNKNNNSYWRDQFLVRFSNRDVHINLTVLKFILIECIIENVKCGVHRRHRDQTWPDVLHCNPVKARSAGLTPGWIRVKDCFVSSEE